MTLKKAMPQAGYGAPQQVPSHGHHNQPQYYPPPSNYPPPMGPPSNYNTGPSPTSAYYPPHHNGNTPSFQPAQPAPYKNNVNVTSRDLTRTPSPTPSEVRALQPRQVRNLSFYLRKEWIWYYLAGGILLVVIILFSVYNHQIVEFLQGPADTIKNLTAGWLIFVAILFVISFPPLFGHEIVSPICGLVYGPGIGFAIVCAGTLLGEIGNFFAFKHCCKARGQKWEKEKIQYGALAKVVREGGFKVALICRYSAIPPHFTTAVFATCDMKFYVFISAAILSLPKQFVEVYVGSVIEQDGTGEGNKKNHLIETIVIVVTIVITVVAMRYIRKRIDAAKPEIVYARRKRRQAKLLEGAA